MLPVHLCRSVVVLPSFSDHLGPSTKVSTLVFSLHTQPQTHRITTCQCMCSVACASLVFLPQQYSCTPFSLSPQLIGHTNWRLQLDYFCELPQLESLYCSTAAASSSFASSKCHRRQLPSLSASFASSSSTSSVFLSTLHALSLSPFTVPPSTLHVIGDCFDLRSVVASFEMHHLMPRRQLLKCSCMQMPP